MSTKLISIHRSRELALEASQGRLLKRIPKPTAKKPMIISASELKTFLRCRVKWLWGYHARIAPRERPKPLAMGDLGHKLLAEWYALGEKERTTKVMRKIVKKAMKLTDPKELTLEEVQLIQAMCVGYSDWSRLRDRELKMKNISSEHFFDLPLLPDGSIRVRGLIDVMFDIGSMKKTVGMFEHKFKSAIRIDSIDLNTQLSVYLWALRELHPKKRDYVAYYNVLRKQMPGPRVKADLFARESIDRTNEEIEQWKQDTVRVCYDMLDAAIYPNPMDTCSWDCDFNTPCILRGRPHDLEHIFQTNYVNKDGTELEIDHGE